MNLEPNKELRKLPFSDNGKDVEEIREEQETEATPFKRLRMGGSETSNSVK